LSKQIVHQEASRYTSTMHMHPIDNWKDRLIDSCI